MDEKQKIWLTQTSVEEKRQVATSEIATESEAKGMGKTMRIINLWIQLFMACVQRRFLFLANYL